MTAKTHPAIVATFPTQSAAWLASARVTANTGLDTEVRSGIEVCGTSRRPCYVLATVTESGAQVAAEMLERFA